MSKKKKKKRETKEAVHAGAVEIEAAGEAAEVSADAEVGAVEELAASEPTRFSREHLDDAESAAAELAASQPTRAGAELEDAEAAAAELDDPEGARTAIRRMPSLTNSDLALDGEIPDNVDTMPHPRVGDDHRFDFGETALTGDASQNPDEPPDPGSADAASPRLQSIVESLLFAADRPLNLRQLADLVDETEVERIRAAVLAIEQSWRERGVQLHEVAGGYQFRTHPANASWVQRLLQQKPIRLSRALLETLAIVSYRQPITRPEIDDIRGVDSGGTLKTLMDRALVRILGKKEEPGRPLLYGTTKEFLEFFSLRDLKDLPTLREYHELSEEHRAQVAALEGKAPAGTFAAEGEEEPVDSDVPDALPKLARLEIAPVREDAAELAEIDRLIRTAGVTTDSDLPTHDPNLEVSLPGEPSSGPFEPDDLVTTGRFEAKPRLVDPDDDKPTPEEAREAAREFDEDRARTGTFGEPLPEPEVAPVGADFEEAESTHVRTVGVDDSLVDGRDPEKEPAA